MSRPRAGLSPEKPRRPPSQSTKDQQEVNGQSKGSPTLKSALKQRSTQGFLDPYPNCKVSGTASAKLSYLIDRLIVLQRDEKILIFYEQGNVAWYIGQALELLGVRYLIYARTLKQDRLNAYIATFNTTETFRVLLMEAHLAAHGLHVASASRVFFVNPVWQPNVEAQAIKRAHRIGQHRPVYVETLVLKDTLEDQMLQRRKRMTNQEHQRAEKSLLDDETMSELIKNAQFLPFAEDEIHDVRKQFAKLEFPQQLFARVDAGYGDLDDPDADLIFPDSSPSVKKRTQKISNSSSPKSDDLTFAAASSTSFTQLSNPSSQPNEGNNNPSVESTRPSISNLVARNLTNSNPADLPEPFTQAPRRRVAFVDEPTSIFSGNNAQAVSS